MRIAIQFVFVLVIFGLSISRICAQQASVALQTQDSSSNPITGNYEYVNGETCSACYIVSLSADEGSRIIFEVKTVWDCDDPIHSSSSPTFYAVEAGDDLQFAPCPTSPTVSVNSTYYVSEVRVTGYPSAWDATNWTRQ